MITLNVFSTQGNMKKRGPDAIAKPSATVGAGNAGVKLLMTLKDRGGEKKEPINVCKKAKRTSVRELGETSKLPTKITKKMQDKDDLTRPFINILQNEDKTTEDKIDMAFGAIVISIRRS